MGKTEVAIKLARSLDTEIVSTDSRQIYRELSIGTAVPEMEQLGYGVRVPTIIVSPYVKRRGVSNEVFDHTSVLKTILMKYTVVIEVAGPVG